METIKVIITSPTSCREVNELPSPPANIDQHNILWQILWQEAESKLRTFEYQMPKFDYDFPEDGPTESMLNSANNDYEEILSKIVINSIHQAKLLKNGKVEII